MPKSKTIPFIPYNQHSPNDQPLQLTYTINSPFTSLIPPTKSNHKIKYFQVNIPTKEMD